MFGGRWVPDPYGLNDLYNLAHVAGRKLRDLQALFVRFLRQQLGGSGRKYVFGRIGMALGFWSRDRLLRTVSLPQSRESGMLVGSE